ncbi:hypothetical protein K2173_027249 [Erythroxylum novogranatense]|uniref:Protein FAM91A1 n=1 Tax=Erythroxylum novogranatense TaxID=1862640 RepID=A0AAV8TYF4_9ROSI|nr:hypothetical protein K2173_027249 [Erythroxylum novogranatense]
MQHVVVTIEEQLILKAITDECQWENLPKRLQATLTSKEEWHRRIVEYCIKKRLQWSNCFACKVCKESEYYEDMMRYLRRNLACHLRYYRDMIFEVMKMQPYDSIPNFSAADALQLTGIGRNEFIDIMNKCRSKKIMWKLNKSIAKELLPTEPVDFAVESWWGVCLVNFTLEEFKKLSEEEMATIDKICKEEANVYILFDPETVKGLYRRGLVYFDVPVYPDDRFKVSRLEGFVSNREQSYEDPIEELLYAVFVVSSENSTVAELATTLQADLSQLQAAASFACRLGWAVKLIDPGSVLQETGIPGSPKGILSDDKDASRTSTSSVQMSNDGSVGQHGSASAIEDRARFSNHARVAFVVDATITSYLMMGSVSPGELQEFANHVFSLRCVLECLLSGGVALDLSSEEVSDKIVKLASNVDKGAAKISSGGKLDGCDSNEAEVQIEDSSRSKLPENGPRCTELVSEGSTHLGFTSSEEGNSVSEISMLEENVNNEYKLVPVEGSDDSKENLRRERKYSVDILRCESLAALAPATLDRLFRRDYDIVLSIIPLPYSAVLPGPKGPIHFGPPSYSSLTPWMKLVLYSTVASGPLSVVLMKGQCLRLLPAPLHGCEKALIWSWDDSTVGGLGCKFEGTLVKGNVLLHCLNSLLKSSAILVQPLSRYDLDESGKCVTLDIPLPIKNSDGSIVCIGHELNLCEVESLKLKSLLTNLTTKFQLPTIGYIRLLKLFNERDSERFATNDEKYEWVPLSAEFGIPLFRPKLCKKICKRVVASGLLQSDSLDVHLEAMQGLRKRLRDVCSEYQATGPAARLLDQKELSKDSSRLLMNYASGRWNPLVDPSSPISGATSENQRLKLANRQRCPTEVLSFDGSILRSYALAPVYEVATRTIEEVPMVSTAKVDPDEADNREVVLPGVNLIFDGSELHPFDIGACLQARQPVSLIAEAVTASASVAGFLKENFSGS